MTTPNYSLVGDDSVVAQLNPLLQSIADRLAQLEGNRGKPTAQDYAQDTGDADRYVIDPDPPWQSDQIIEGTQFRFLAATANTGASTLTVNGTEYDIKTPAGSDLSANYIAADSFVTVEYDGEYMLLRDVYGIGSIFQAYDADLSTIGGLAKTDGNIIVGDGTNWVVESGATARTSLGLGTGDSPQFTGVNVGHASDTTITKHAAGIIAIEGIAVPRMDGSTVGTKDNAIVRVSGTGGGLIQGQTSDLGPIINDDGSVVNTVQPAFLAYNSATDADVIGTAGTGFVTVDFDTEVFDQGGDFSGDTFTAPVTGKYLLTAGVVLVGMTAANDGCAFVFVTSNRTYLGAAFQKNNFVIETSLGLAGSAVVDMDVGDTAVVQARSLGEATNVVDIYGEAAPTTFFSGCLLA